MKCVLIVKAAPFPTVLRKILQHCLNNPANRH